MSIESILQVNGREIFQQERVDKGHRENRQRGSRSAQETDATDGTRKALTADAMTEELGQRGLCSPLPNESEMAEVVIWCRNRIFVYRKHGGEISKGRSPLLLA